MKIIDKQNQIKQLTSDIIASDELLHYIIYRNELLYITSLEDARECVDNRGYTPIGVITKLGNNESYIKDQIIKLL